MLPTVIFLSIMTVTGLLFILKRFMSWRLIIRLSIPIDILFSIGMLLAGAGSITGLAVAVTSAVLLSVVLHVLKVSQRGLEATKTRRRPTIVWKEV